MEEPAEWDEHDGPTGASSHTNGDHQRPVSSNRLTGRPFPQRPELPSPSPRTTGFPWPLFVALLLVAGGLVLLTFLSTGLLMPLAFVAGAIFLYCAFHYVVWGWWLGAAIRREEEEDK